MTRESPSIREAVRCRLPPSVAFYKPQGTFNEHPGYTDVLSGDAHIAALIARIKASPLWASSVIIVSPFAKKGFVDHTVYDTTSIIKFITLRFGLEPLPGVRQNVGDLTPALEWKGDR